LPEATWSPYGSCKDHNGLLKRKSMEPIALAAGMPVRTLQEFLAYFVWDEDRVSDGLQRWMTDEHGRDGATGVLDASAHHKQGEKTQEAQRSSLRKPPCLLARSGLLQPATGGLK